nr:acidic phospholipase A2 PLA-1 [Zonotrichia albicollis]
MLRDGTGGPGERKMKVLLVLTMLFACNAHFCCGKVAWEVAFPGALNPPSAVLGLALASCNLAQFAAMIKKKTGKSALAYNGYGCHCGWGGSKQPLDATDRCCHAHDCCYKKLVAAGCKPKTTTYKYSFQKNQITCGNGKPCQKRACECDKRAVECFQRAASSYRKSYSNYPNSKC